jgi:hypothetical protein
VVEVVSDVLIGDRETEVAQDRGQSLACVLVVVAALDRSQVAVDGLRIKPAATHAHTVHEGGIIWCQVSSFEGLLMQGSCVLEQAWRCLRSASGMFGASPSTADRDESGEVHCHHLRFAHVAPEQYAPVSEL